MRKEEIYYDSRDGINKVYGMYWIPDGEIVGILQIIHGMAEHIGRYDDFASYMATNGFLVVANDHIGHGKSLIDDKDKGYFCEDDSVTVVTRDVHRLKKITQDKYPGLPYVILGHSMGSLILRNYLFRYGKGIDGAIIMGTANHSNLESFGGKLVLKMIAAFKGWRCRSRFADSIVNSDCNARISNPRTDFDWLTRDEAIVDKYIADAYCGFLFTVNGLYMIVDCVGRINNKTDIDSIPKELPVLFVSGQEDPVGSYGAGVKTAYDMFVNAGMKNVSMKLYPEARHEILNEINKEEVYADLLKYIKNSVILQP